MEVQIRGFSLQHTNNRQKIILGFIFSWSFLATVVLALRLYSRIKLVRYRGLDDWLIVGAWIISLIDAALWIILVGRGDGKHVQGFSISEGHDFFQFIFIIQILYPLCLGFIKVSILVFYLRLFPDETFRRITKASIIFVCLQTIATSFSIIFACSPISKQFAPREGPGTVLGFCVNIPVLLLILAGLNLGTDIWVLILPMKWLLESRLNRAKNLEVVGLFSLGAFACIASTARIAALHTVIRSRDPAWDSFSVSICAAIELNLGIITASLPAIKPLLKKCIWKGRKNSTATSESTMLDSLPASRTRDF